MTSIKHPVALRANDVPPKNTPSNYPPLYAAQMQGRIKRAIGDPFGLANFGVNLTRLAPKAVSALRHAHSRQDEFIYVLEGHPTLVTDAGISELAPGMCAGFRAGVSDGHQLVNMTNNEVVFIEIGDRTAGDSVFYPDDDIEALLDTNGKWEFRHKDGTPY